MISIIIPVFNSSSFIEETLNSLINQTFTNWECILVDDGSTDQTEKIIEKFLTADCRFQFYKRPANLKKGPSSCRNFGFSVSKGKYIHFMDSDDIYLPIALKSYSACLNEFQDAVVAPLEFIDNYTLKKIKKNNIFSKNLLEDYFTGKISFYVSGSIWRRDFLKDKILFDPDLRNLEDWDFNLRMIYYNPKIVYINEALLQYRIHKNSLSSEITKMNYIELKSEFRAREKNLDIIINRRLTDPKILREFIITRYKYVLRNALTTKDNHRFFYLKKLLIQQYKQRKILEMLRTMSGFTFFYIFHKGYKFLIK